MQSMESRRKLVERLEREAEESPARYRLKLALLAALGYCLIERLRTLALAGTALATAQVDTLRIKLLKVAAVITRNTRRVRLYLASNWPSADIFVHAVTQLRSP